MKNFLTIALMIFAFWQSLKGNDLNALDVWGFNEGKGDIFINSIAAYGNGKLFGNYKWSQDGFISFDGKNSYGLIECATRDGKSLSAKHFAVYCRFKLSQLPKDEYFTIVSGLKCNFYIKLHGNKNETWIIVSWLDADSGDRYSLVSGSKKRGLKPEEWLQFLFSINGKNAKLFVNGEADMYKKYYFVPKGSKKGEHIALDKNNGFPYSGQISLKGLTFGVEQRGSLKRHWLPGSIDCLLLFNAGLSPEDIPAISKLLETNNAKKIVPAVEL